MGNRGDDIRCNCYKVLGLSTPILETSNISYLGDRYVLGDQLGWGQFGVIRACTDLVTGDHLACKSIAKERLISAEDFRSVKLEIEIMARLSDHPNVVALKAVYEEKDYVHLVMELCAVVMYCHDNGIVHRDLKPENVLLATKSSSSAIKLADFGLATYIEPGQRLYGIVGSPFYIAPDVLVGGYNQAADVWSAGVILYILLSGMPPFWGKTKSRIFDAVRSAELQFPSDPWDDVSESAKELVAGMLCRNTTQRLTAKQVLEHSWIKENAQKLQGADVNQCVAKSLQEDVGNFSFSVGPMTASRDVSFGFSPQENLNYQQNHDFASPSFACRASFYPFQADDTACFPSVGFSFRSMGFSPPPPLIPSFSFFSHPPPDQQGNLFDFTATEIETNSMQRGSESGVVKSTGLKEHDARKGSASASRTIGLRSRRNHTIGMGELEQLDVMVVSESVIRWASCVHLSGAASLRASLVCG
ncbi:hypothetical protein HPP92_008386 [Vanilla planifolia]|uniref:Protein kinase domain-containing protein n=1 Tax=Vanilla planifolia TaxID=51239 RepID=A0A835RDK3_VANPL|nr:hypothetical protein HPP92_008386 [Vanilla planifolia]